MKSMPMEPPVFDVATLIAGCDMVMAQGNMTMTDNDRRTTPYA
jgi:hypothetical protein